MDAIDLKHENLRLKDLVEQRGQEINALAADLKSLRAIAKDAIAALKDWAPADHEDCDCPTCTVLDKFGGI